MECRPLIALLRTRRVPTEGGDEKLTSAKNTNDFHLAETIDEGSFGKVMLEKTDSEVFVMKIFRKENVCGRNQVEHTKTGSNVLEVVSHPFFVQIHFALQTPSKLHFELESCLGGDLFFHPSHTSLFCEDRCMSYAPHRIT